MTFSKEHFVELLCGRYGSKIPTGVYTDIEEEIETLSDHDRKYLFDEIKGSKFTPTLFGVRESIDKLGLSKISNKHFVYECVDCGARYAEVNNPFAAYRCPKCGSFERRIVEWEKGDYLIVFQLCCVLQETGLGNCPQLNELMRNPKAKGVYGPSCKNFMQNNQQECSSCACSDCCKYNKKLIIDNENQFKE